MATVGQLQRILRKIEETKRDRARRNTIGHTQVIALKGAQKGSYKKITHFKDHKQAEVVREIMIKHDSKKII